MAGKEPDKVTREIEELLEQLDNFVPEERLASKIRTKRKRQRDESRGPSWFDGVRARISRVTLGQLMLTGLALMLISYFFRGPLGSLAGWMTIAGLLMTVAAFVLSVMGGGARSTIGTSRVQQRWRGQTIEYGSQPSAFDRVKAWFRRRGRS
jgi:hypothetical protein